MESIFTFLLFFVPVLFLFALRRYGPPGDRRAGG